jgi:hypothetical protein
MSLLPQDFAKYFALSISQQGSPVLANTTLGKGSVVKVVFNSLILFLENSHHVHREQQP